MSVQEIINPAALFPGKPQESTIAVGMGANHGES